MKEQELMNKFNISIQQDTYEYSQITDARANVTKAQVVSINQNPEIIVEEDDETSKTITTILNAPTPDSYYRHDLETGFKF